MPIANILEGLFGGLNQGVQDIQTRRKQALDEQLRQRQLKTQEQQLAFSQFMEKFKAIPGDASVDPALLQEASGYGLANQFAKMPDGTIRRIKTVSDQVQDLNLANAQLTNTKLKFDHTQDLEKTNPQLYGKLMALPLDQRKFAAAQAGVPAPMTREEEYAELELKVNTNPSVIAARERSAVDLQIERMRKQPQGLSGLVDMVAANPDLLRTMSPTQRSSVLLQMAQEGKSMPNQQQESLAGVMRAGLAAAKKMRDHPGKSAAIGLPDISDVGSIPRIFGMDPRQGSQAADFNVFLEQFRSLKTIPQLEVLRGLGHMSDREFASIQRAATTLSGNMREETFDKELDEAIQSLENAIGRYERGERITKTDSFGILPDDASGKGGATLGAPIPTGKERFDPVTGQRR